MPTWEEETALRHAPVLLQKVHDRYQAGEIAWAPAYLVWDYFTGMREFSREYIHNLYVGVTRP